MSDPKSWLEKRAVGAAYAVLDRAKDTNTVVDKQDIAVAIMVVAREFAERALERAIVEYDNDFGPQTMSLSATETRQALAAAEVDDPNEKGAP